MLKDSMMDFYKSIQSSQSQQQKSLTMAEKRENSTVLENSTSLIILCYRWTSVNTRINNQKKLFTSLRTSTEIKPEKTSTYFLIILTISWLSTWACSPGGPGRNWDEHNADSSTFGTENKTFSNFPIQKYPSLHLHL